LCPQIQFGRRLSKTLSSKLLDAPQFRRKSGWDPTFRRIFHRASQISQINKIVEPVSPNLPWEGEFEITPNKSNQKLNISSQPYIKVDIISFPDFLPKREFIDIFFKTTPTKHIWERPISPTIQKFNKNY